MGFLSVRSSTQADWEELFRSWAKPPSATERQKCVNAETAVKKAIEAYTSFPTRIKAGVTVFAQGSYANRTNIGLESDVDVNVCCDAIFFSDFTYATGLTADDLLLVDATYSYADFKDAVGSALKDHFGEDGFSRGNKAFDIHENTYRVDADVVATLEYRRWTHQANGVAYYTRGVQFLPDDGGRIINWPAQNYDNGVSRNTRTGKRFKALARVLKQLRCEMVADDVAAAKDIGSFLLECLAYNVTDVTLMLDDYYHVVRVSLIELYQATKNDDAAAASWFEVNGLKPLFETGQPWTREQVNSFIVAAWGFVGFK